MTYPNEAQPLGCPDCGGRLKFLGFTTNPVFSCKQGHGPFVLLSLSAGLQSVKEEVAL